MTPGSKTFIEKSGDKIRGAARSWQLKRLKMVNNCPIIQIFALIFFLTLFNESLAYF